MPKLAFDQNQFYAQPHDFVQLVAHPDKAFLDFWQNIVIRGAALQYSSSPILCVTRADELVRNAVSAESVPWQRLTLEVAQVVPVSDITGSLDFVMLLNDHEGTFADLRLKVAGDSDLDVRPHMLLMHDYTFSRTARTSLLALSNSLHGRVIEFDRFEVTGDRSYSVGVDGLSDHSMYQF